MDGCYPGARGCQGLRRTWSGPATAAGVLDRGRASLDAVETAIKLFEDKPLFNAGRNALY